MSRMTNLAVAGVSALAMTAGSVTAEAAPMPVQNAVQVGGRNAAVDHVGWRRGYGGYGGGGYGYRRGYGGRAAGALAAGAALGIIGGAIAASAAPRYGYYGGYDAPSYGYAPAGYGYGYAPARSYGYGYAPARNYGYGHPAYGYGYDGYGW